MGALARFLGLQPPLAMDPDGAKAVPDGVSAEPGVVETFRNWGSPWDHYGSIYQRQPAVRTVVDFLATNIAQLSVKVYQRRAYEDRLELRDHPMAQTLRAPNPDTTPYRFWRDTVADRAIYDRAYWVKIRQPRTGLKLIRIPPRSLIVETDPRTLRRIWRLQDGTRLNREDLVIFSGYHPEGTGEGVSPLETLRRTLEEEWEGQQHRRMYWRNAARQGGVIERPLEAPDWSDVSRKRFRDDWQSAMAGGANAGKTAILEEGMTWNPSAFSPEQSQYIEGRKLTFKEVARAYAPSLVGLMADDEPKANVEAYHRQLYQDVLAPWTRSFEDELELQLLPEFESGPAGRSLIYCEFNLHEKLRGSFAEQAAALTTAIGVAYLSVNEGRAMVNKTRIDDPDFDVPIKPLNVMYGGQPAPTIPTEVPQPRVAHVRPLALGPGMKAVPKPVLVRRDRAARDHTRILRTFFTEQERSVLSAIGAQKAVLPGWDGDRWNTILEDRLYPAANRLVRQSGELAAGQMRGTYNHALAVEWVANRTRIAAETINQSTLDEVADAYDREGLDGARAVFEEARTSRAEHLAFGTVAGLIGFGRLEAARQSEQADGRRRMKTWVVTSNNSRHPDMDGESVPVGEPFSNGAAYPGDPVAGADEVANCRCLLQLS